MNDVVAEILLNEYGPRFAYDTYARFTMNFGVIVLGKDPMKYFEIMQVERKIFIPTFILNFLYIGCNRARWK